MDILLTLAIVFGACLFAGYRLSKPNGCGPCPKSSPSDTSTQAVVTGSLARITQK